jgi:hypothetical protein
MFRRVILFLLVCCLAAPAMAMTGHCSLPEVAQQATATDCHEGMTQIAMDHANPDHSEKRQPQPPQKDCIGCVTPLATQAPALARPDLAPQRHASRLVAAFAPTVAAPETPPPRT